MALSQRRDPLYHCRLCPAGPDNSFDRLSSRAGNSSSSFERHVQKHHPDHQGDYKELRGPTTYKYRTYKKKVYGTAGTKEAEKEAAPATGKSGNGVTGGKVVAKKPAKKAIRSKVQKAVKKPARKPLAVKVSKLIPLYYESSSSEEGEDDEDDDEDNEEESEADDKNDGDFLG